MKSLGHVELLYNEKTGRLYTKQVKFTHIEIHSLPRFVYEKLYGKVPKGMEIHHINLNPLDNNPSNLIAIPSKYHSLIHRALRSLEVKYYLTSELKKEMIKHERKQQKRFKLNLPMIRM